MFYEMKAESICEVNSLNTKERIKNCDTYIEINLDSLDYSYIRITFDDSFDVSVPELSN